MWGESLSDPGRRFHRSFNPTHVESDQALTETACGHQFAMGLRVSKVVVRACCYGKGRVKCPLSGFRRAIGNLGSLHH